VPLLLVRHASAGDRARWDGDDGERPLDDRGRRQAAALPALLESYRIDAILSSPAVRCVQTVAPLAEARGLRIETRVELGEDRQMDAGAALVRSLGGRDVVVCGHGGLEIAALDGQVPRWRKGAAFVVSHELTVEQTIRG
jgi:phosphohistidine phosphatase SixA